MTNETHIEFIKHLRAIHFTLVLTCFALMVTVNLSPTANIENAYTQVREIKRISKELNSKDSHWFYTHIGMKVPLYKLIDNKFYAANHDKKVLIKFHFDEGLLKTKIGYYGATDHSNKLFGFIRIYNMTDFEAIWNDLIEFKYAYQISELPKFAIIIDKSAIDQQETGTTSIILSSVIQASEIDKEKFGKKNKVYREYCMDNIHFLFSFDLNENEKLNNALKRIDLPQGYKLFSKNQILISKKLRWFSTFNFKARNCRDLFPDRTSRSNIFIVIPISLQKVEVNLFEAFNQKFLVDWKKRKFEEEFKDLDMVSKNLESLDLDQLENYVERIRTEQGPIIQLFGLSLPRKIVSNWGIITLLCIQLYVFMHLYRFYRFPGLIEKDSYFPWIGLYPYFLSKLLLYATISVLPFVTSLFLAMHGFQIYDKLNAKSLIFIGVLISVTLSICTTIEIMRFHKKMSVINMKKKKDDDGSNEI